MVKNKKGKKKNKMAGRNRPNPEQATECEDKNAPVALSDTSETEDRADRARGKEGVTPEPEVLTSDSGIDSGRGSPGDDRDSSKATGAAKINTQPRIIEEGTLEDAKVESAPEMNPDRAEAIAAGVAAEVEARSPVPLDVRKSEESAENPQVGSEQKIESKTEERAEKHAEEPASVPSAKPGVVKDGARRGVSARPKGASSLRRHSPVENIKHPLEFPWEFWIMDKEQSWELALKPLASFDTAEDFWLYFNRLRDPRALGKEILMFKKHIKPEWEHPRNENGGRWNLSHGLHGRAAEEVWQELALMMIGGIKFDALTPHLNGIYCTWKNDGIHYSVWIDSTEDRIARPIGNIIHETLFSILNKSFHMELVQCNSKKRDRRRVLLDIR